MRMHYLIYAYALFDLVGKQWVSAISGKSVKCEANPFLHKNARELSGKFGPFLQCQGYLTLFTDIQEIVQHT